MRKKDRGAVSEPSHSSSESFAQTHSRGEDAVGALGEAVYLQRRLRIGFYFKHEWRYKSVNQ